MELHIFQDIKMKYKASMAIQNVDALDENNYSQ